MTFDLGMTFDCMNIWQFPYYINKPSLVPIRLQLFKWGHFHIFSLSYNLTSDDLWPWYMTFDHMNIWQSPYHRPYQYTKFGSNQTSTFQMKLLSHFQPFQMRLTFTFSAYLATWPQMIFDLDMWPLTSSTDEGSHVASMTQLWLKSIKVFGS